MEVRFSENQFEEYKRLCRTATREGMKSGAEFIKERAASLAPKANKHRVKRTYPGGRVYRDTRPIHRSLIARTRDKGDRGIVAWVRAKVGYSIFVEYGTKFMKARSFLRRARNENIDRLMNILREKWPK